MMTGREISAGVANPVDPEFDPIPGMDLLDWVDTVEYPEGREDLLAAMPDKVRARLREMGYPV